MRVSHTLYAATVFLSSLLLFLIEPIAAKQLLPILGGSSAVWMTCLVFFQFVLLGGYLYAHWMTRRSHNGQVVGSWPARVHLVLLAAAVAMLALTVQAVADSNQLSGFFQVEGHPVRSIFLMLSLSIGLPFLVLASTSPLLQVWLARTESVPVPYRLFALSNVGSLLALFLYPLTVEPVFTLHHQRLLWSMGFLLYAVLSGTIAWNSGRAGTPPEAARESSTEVATTRQRVLWFLLPMAAAMQLAAVTGHLTENIAAIPLLWMLPLSVYLASFIVAFEFPRLYRRATVSRLLVVLLASLGYALSKTDFSLPIGISITFFLGECFVACLFCHAEVHALRPAGTSETTLFYLLIAAGGAAGTFFIGIVCPLLFSANYDLALAFSCTAALAVAITWEDGSTQRLLWGTATAGLLLLSVMLHVAYSRDALLLRRNFYGSLRVKQTDYVPVANGPGAPLRMMLNGTIQHGTQIFSPALSRTPTTYYASNSGVGLALTLCCQGRPRKIGVIGLGAGTLAAYGERGDRIRIYELNPLVEPIARNLFTYLRDSPARIEVVPGDARTSLAREIQTSSQQFDVLAIDAFSGDAIPLHLLTTQAIALYKRHLAPGGILAFHVSNQYVDLAPEIALLAEAAHLEAVSIESADNHAEGAYRASWVLATSNAGFLAQPAIAQNSGKPATIPGLRLWTDDYSSVLALVKF